MKLSLAILLSALFMVACSSEPKVEEKDIQVSPKIDHEAFRQTFRGGLKEIRACYENLPKNQPKPEGKAVVHMTIDSEGKATKVETVKEQTTITDQNLLSCMNTRIATWKFPPASANNVADVTYPFYFRADPNSSDKPATAESTK